MKRVIALLMVVLGLLAVVTPAQARIALARMQDNVSASEVQDDAPCVICAAAIVQASMDTGHGDRRARSSGDARAMRQHFAAPAVILRADRAHE